MDWDQAYADDTFIDTKSDLLISCSMDYTLVATDITSGKEIWRTKLNIAPLCLDITKDGAYIGMGKLRVSYTCQFIPIRSFVTYFEIS